MRPAFLLASVLVLICACGCIHRKSALAGAGRESEMTVSRITAVVAGPGAAFLTNESFQADCVIAPAGETKHPWKLSGRLAGNHGRLWLETEPGKSKIAGGFGVIWDLAARQGYVYSEALQGYAPLSMPHAYTNLLPHVLPDQADRMEGHPMQVAEATFAGPDEEPLVLRMTRAKDLNGLPLQISVSGGKESWQVTLTKLQIKAPEESTFLPPDGFTKYATDAALLDELASRQQNFYGGGRNRGGMNANPGEPGDHSGYDRRSGNWQ